MKEPIPFTFRVLNLSENRELVYIPKLSDDDLSEVSRRFKEMGMSHPREARQRPRIIQFNYSGAVVRLMPRGLVVGPPGIFENVATKLSFKLSRVARDAGQFSWTNNNFQQAVTKGRDTVLRIRGRFIPTSARFLSVVSRMGGFLATDEIMVIKATVQASWPESVEFMAAKSFGAQEAEPPLRLAGGSFLHKVSMGRDAFLALAEEAVNDRLHGANMVLPLPNTTIVLRRPRFPRPPLRELKSLAGALLEWVSDEVYFTNEGASL